MLQPSIAHTGDCWRLVISTWWLHVHMLTLNLAVVGPSFLQPSIASTGNFWTAVINTWLLHVYIQSLMLGKTGRHCTGLNSSCGPMCSCDDIPHRIHPREVLALSDSETWALLAHDPGLLDVREHCACAIEFTFCVLLSRMGSKL